AGIAPASTWNGTPRPRRLARNFATSSPSTSSSVSASSRCAAGPASTNVTAFSPATMPTPMRMASKARCEVRGSAAMRTTTGASSTTGGRSHSVQRDEAVSAVDQIGQHDQAAVTDGGIVLERNAALLAAVGAHEELGAPAGQGAQPSVTECLHAVVDEVEIEIGPARERGVAEPEGGLQLGMAGPPGEQNAQFFLGDLHREARLTSRWKGSKR